MFSFNKKIDPDLKAIMALYPNKNHRILIKYGPFLNQKHYKELCNIVIGGDPKGRSIRALDLRLFMDVAKESSV